jgi:hypothetical protein
MKPQIEILHLHIGDKDQKGEYGRQGKKAGNVRQSFPKLIA